jgi:uncharacterized membrane protein
VDPFERHFQRRINWEAIVAFLVGVLVAYVVSLKVGQSNLLTVLIVAGIGGLWYHLRRVV